MPHQFRQTESCRCVMPRAEAQARVEHNHRLAGLGLALDPAWPQQQRRADFDGLEVPLPRFRPIFAGEATGGDFTAAEVESGWLDVFQFAGQSPTVGLRPHGKVRFINRHHGGLGLFIGINRWRLAENSFQYQTNGLLGFRCGRHGYFQQRFLCHAPVLQGIWLSDSSTKRPPSWIFSSVTLA